MPTVTLSSKHQVTLPADLVRSLGLKPGDKLVAELIGGRIVLLPQPQSWVDYFAESLKGVYGSTVEEIDRYIREVRGYHLYGEWRQEFEDLVATDAVAMWIVDRLRQQEGQTMPELDFYMLDDCPGGKQLEDALEKLVAHGAVRKIPASPEVREYGWLYRLVRDFAKR